MNYEYVLKLLMNFEAVAEWSLQIRLLHRANLATLKKDKKYWGRFFKLFSHFLYGRGYSDHCVVNVFKILKTFFNYLINDRGYCIGNYNKTFRIPLLQTAPVVLSPEQLRFLITDSEFNATLSPSLQRARDIFVVGCTIGLRVSDLMNLRKVQLRQSGESSSISVITQKTATEISIPVPEYVTSILAKYQQRAGKYLLPRLSKTNLNLQVKLLAKKAGWDYTVPKFRSYRGRLQELKKKNGKSWLFYDHITAHTMRRTAITTLLILKVPEWVVRKISGHAPGSKEFYKYVSIAQDYLNQEVKQAYVRLLGPKSDW